MSEFIQLTDNEILTLIRSYHKWELRKGVLYYLGINPDSFDWGNEQNQNADPMRVYNWCCTVLNDRDHEYLPGQPKLLPATKSDKEDGQSFEILRDILIPFCFYEWPNFTKRTYLIWKAYRLEKDGPTDTKATDLIVAVGKSAISEYLKKEKQYSLGLNFPARREFERRVAEQKNISESGVRKACTGQVFNLAWVKAHLTDPQYQENPTA